MRTVDPPDVRNRGEALAQRLANFVLSLEPAATEVGPGGQKEFAVLGKAVDDLVQVLLVERLCNTKER